MVSSGIVNIICAIIFNVHAIIRDESEYLHERPMGCPDLVWLDSAFPHGFGFYLGKYLGKSPGDVFKSSAYLSWEMACKTF